MSRGMSIDNLKDLDHLKSHPINSEGLNQNGLPIASEEGAASPPVIDTGLDDALYSFEWSIDGVVQVGESGASIIATTGGVYQVTITTS